MGHGRHIRPLVGRILLIVSTIQGITPDSRDLASQNVIVLLGPSLVGEYAFPDDDDPPEETGPAVPETGIRQAHRAERPWGTAYPATFDRRGPADAESLPRTGSSPVVERRPAPDLSLTLCRLVC
jgi:hypothetical protein